MLKPNESFVLGLDGDYAAIMWHMMVRCHATSIELKGIVHPKIRSLSLFDHPHHTTLFFFKTQMKIFFKRFPYLQIPFPQNFDASKNL